MEVILLVGLSSMKYFKLLLALANATKLKSLPLSQYEMQPTKFIFNTDWLVFKTSQTDKEFWTFSLRQQQR